MEIYIYHVPGVITASRPGASLKGTSLLGKIVSTYDAEVLTRCYGELQSAEQVLIVDVTFLFLGHDCKVIFKEEISKSA